MKFFLLLILIHISAEAKDLPIVFGGFIDTYYAYDTNRPSSNEREFTTQASKHNSLNVNLAYLDATIKEEEKIRGRLAFQLGNSVTKNYASEQNRGASSGPEELKYIQEAFVGMKLTEDTFVDIGIFLGHIGAESWISKDNWTYTRALNLDFVPYYSAGIRLSHKFNQHQSIQVHIINGWQNITETNESKAFGIQYKNIISRKLVFTYNNFLGDEEVVRDLNTLEFNSRFRTYHNFIFQYLYSETWNYLAAFDFGHQSQQNNDGTDPWYSSTFTIRRILDEIKSLSLRMEYYNDRHQTNINTFTDNGFQVVGASLNYDHKLGDKALWRTEMRGFHSKDEIYTQGRNNKNRNDGVFVTSFSMWF